MITLVSPQLTVEIDLLRGGAITSIISRSTNDEWIYYDRSRRAPNASLENYDDVWCGGFEELFPNDAVTVIDGRTLKDHGELWQQEWTVLHRTPSSLSLEAQCTTVPARVRKTVALNDCASTMDITYEIHNVSDEQFHYLFKLHPAMRIEEEDEILLPNGTILPVDTSFGTLIDSPGPFRWPMITDRNGNTHNISIIPKQSKKTREFVYVTEMTEGWCGLKRKQTGEKFFIRYSLSQFPYCWLFMALGGWRDYYTVVLEPCTNFPKDMNAAIANGTSAIMKPNEIHHFAISVTLEK